MTRRRCSARLSRLKGLLRAQGSLSTARISATSPCHHASCSQRSSRPTVSRARYTWMTRHTGFSGSCPQSDQIQMPSRNSAFCSTVLRESSDCSDRTSAPRRTISQSMTPRNPNPSMSAWNLVEVGFSPGCSRSGGPADGPQDQQQTGIGGNSAAALVATPCHRGR
jgi:hypothetical protein